MQAHNSTSFKLLIAAAISVPALLFMTIVWQDYKSIISSAQTEVSRTVKAFEQHALNVFETHQLVAERINDHLKDMSWEEIEQSRELSRYLSKIEKQYPQVSAIWLADPSGIIRNASVALPPAPVSVADRDYFHALRSNDHDLFIGHIVKPRVMKDLNFNVAYRRGGSSGRFNGVIVVTAFPDYFSRFWNSVTSAKDSASVLLRSDGSVLARSPGIDLNRLILPADSRPMLEIKRGRQGSYTAASVHDGTQRIFAFHKVDKFDVFIIHGVNMQSVLQPWYEHTVIYACFSGAALLLLVLLALSAQKHARSIQASEAALRERENIYRAIGESIDYGIWVCDPEGRNLYASESFLRLVGMTQEECSDFGWGNILHPDDADRTIAAWKECVQSEGVWDIEHRYLGADGLYHFILARGVPVKDDNGKITHWVGINLDISRIKLAEEKLKTLNEELDHLVDERTRELQENNLLLIQQSRLAAMGEMIQNVAHQWRQPLNTLGLKIQSLPIFYASGKLDRELLDTTVSSAMTVILHMSKTIDDFRNFFKPDKDKEAFQVEAVIESAIRLIEASFQNSHIKIIKHYTDNTIAYGFPNEYSQVVLNILSNAKDALLANRTANPVVTITSFMAADRSVVMISDNAGGIPEDIILKVFDPHFSTKGPQGTGIGLFMAKNIIEKSMSGNLNVSNNESGAVFRIEV